MKRFGWTAVALLAAGFFWPGPAAAQQDYHSGMTTQSGLFGNRRLGMPIEPGRGGLAPGVQTGPSGAFLYIGTRNGATAFATPWIRIDPLVLDLGAPQPYYGRPIVEVWPQTPASSTESQTPRVATTTQQPTPSTTEATTTQTPTAKPTTEPTTPSASATATETEMETAANQSEAATATGAEPVAAAAAPQAPQLRPNIALHERKPEVRVAVNAQAYTRSATLSDRLTKIARNRNMLAGQGINVYVDNNMAVMQGEVRTANDRMLLGRVLALEPQLWQVENRLTTPATTTPPAGSPQP